jgi:dTDP-glucose 4,6-dehydratase
LAKSALVTGAAGFLGSHLTDRLLGDGYLVLGVDNLSTGDPENLAHLANDSRFRFEERDICTAFDPGRVDYVFNLDWGNVNPVGPRSVYDEAKRFGEAMVMAYHRSRGVNTRMARIFNTYGPRLHPGDGRVISNFLMQALRGEPFTIYGDGRQTRSFCYVDDLIEGIVRLSRSEEHLPVNLGNSEEYTILECANAVLEVTGSKSEMSFVELPVDDPMRRRPDITKARTLLGWEPRVGLKDGLKKSLEFFRSRAT